MATFTVSNVERHSDGTPWDYAKVTIGAAGPAYDSNGNSIDAVAPPKQTAADGSVQFTGLTTGVVYTWTHPDGRQETFQAASAGTYTLSQVAGPFVPAGGVGVTSAQLAAAQAQARRQALIFANA